MQRDRLVLGLTVVFAGMTAILLLVSLAFREPVLLVVAVPLGAATYAFWYQSSGALRERLRRTRRRPDPGGQGAGRQGGSGGFGAGPRPGFEGARGQQARERWQQRQRAGQGRGAGPGRGQRGRGGPQQAASMRPAEAYSYLGLEQGADEAAVRRAYRERVKEVHPDRGGDEEEFRKVTEAYETLQG